jgi:PfaB family protein
MITSGSLIALLYTLILRDIFKVQPDFALGYSLGEIGMLFAMQIWDQADAVSAALRESSLFQAQLSGHKLAVRSHWSLPPTADDSLPVWENHFLMSPVEKVKAALEHADTERVYLTHINTPRQVVIGGDPAACARLISILKCTSLKAPFDFTLHCAAIQSAYPALVELLSWPVAAHPTAQLFSAAGFTPLTLDSKTIAEKISTMLCSPLDFPTLVHQVYAGGARVFIELGANANCTKWIEESLKGENFAAVAVNRKGVEDLASLVKLLARLVSHRVPLDLAPLYP